MSNDKPEALRLAEELEGWSEGPDTVALLDAAAAELRRLHAECAARDAEIAAMREALRIAEQFIAIASDWNIDEAEIDGEMRSTYDLLDVVRAALSAKGAK